MDETYILVGGRWRYLKSAVDKLDQTVDFLLTAHRDVAAARRFFERAIELHDVPASITIDESGANTAAVRGLIADSGAPLRQSAASHPCCDRTAHLAKRSYADTKRMRCCLDLGNVKP